MIGWLQARPDWRLVHADTTAVVFVRTAADGSSPWPEVDIQAPDFLPVSPSRFRIVREAREAVRLRLLAALGVDLSGAVGP